MKKVIGILMVLILAFSMFTGCGKKSTDTTDSTVTKAPEDTATDSAATAEPLSFKVMTVSFGANPTGTVANDAWLAQMEKLMGRELDIQFEYVAMADYQEKIKIMLASNELPDLITSWGLEQKDIFNYGENGTFVDLTANMDKLPLYKKYLDAAPDSAVNLYSSAGKLYGFYNVQRNWQAYSGGSNEIDKSTAIRKDIFDANQIPYPKTIDDLYAAAKKLKEIYPDKYPMTLAAQWMPPMDILASANHFTCGFESTNFNGRSFDGTKFVYAPLTDAYKEALMEMNKWYTEGLISPDFFTQTNADGDGAVAAGDAMIMPSVWYGSPSYWNIQYPDQKWMVIAGLENPKYGKPWLFSKGSSDDVRILPNWGVLVNAKSKNVDELLKFMDFQMDDSISDILNWGVEGQTYTVTDGAKHYVEAVKTDTEFLNKAGVGSGSCRSGIFPQTQDNLAGVDILQLQGLTADFQFNGQITTNTVPGFIKENYNDEQASEGTKIIVNPITADDAEVYANIMTPINTYAAEQMAAFITGNRSFNEWDAYLEELNAMGDIQKAMTIYDGTVVGKKK